MQSQCSMRFGKAAFGPASGGAQKYLDGAAVIDLP
jgi:hypothetical protein